MFLRISSVPDTARLSIFLVCGKDPRECEDRITGRTWFMELDSRWHGIWLWKRRPLLLKIEENRGWILNPCLLLPYSVNFLAYLIPLLPFLEGRWMWLSRPPINLGRGWRKEGGELHSSSVTSSSVLTTVCVQISFSFQSVSSYYLYTHNFQSRKSFPGLIFPFLSGGSLRAWQQPFNMT